MSGSAEWTAEVQNIASMERPPSGCGLKMEEEPFPEGMDALKMECGKVNDENVVLKRCLRLLRDNSALETATLLSAVVAFCDGKFRRKFADGLEGLPIGDKVMSQTERALLEVLRGSQTTQTSSEHVYSPAPTAFSQEMEERPARYGAEGDEDRSHYVKPATGPSQGGDGRPVAFKDLIHEQPVRDRPTRKKPRQMKVCCQAICHKSPPVSLGGRQLKSPDHNPYFYPSEPDSHHLRSHMQTQTAFVSDLEYDVLYLRSLALAAGYRALAKGLDSAKAGPDRYRYVSPDRLCRHVSGIPPSIMFKRKGRIRPMKLIHTCVSPKPTRCYPFSREGRVPGDEIQQGRRRKGSTGKKKRINLQKAVYETDMRSLSSPLATTQDPGQPYKTHHTTHRPLYYTAKVNKGRRHRADQVRRCSRCGSKRQASEIPGGSDSESEPRKKKSQQDKEREESRTSGKSASRQKEERQQQDVVAKGSDYDFQAVVAPIIDQARQCINQATGAEPVQDDLTSFSLKHTHKEYTYQPDGSAVVQSDTYKKSFNWSSDEEHGEMGQEGEGEDGAARITEVSDAGFRSEMAEDVKSLVEGVQGSLRDSEESSPTRGEEPTTDEEEGVSKQPAASPSSSEQPDLGEKKGLQLSESGHVHWDPTTRFDTHNSEHLIHVTNDPHPKKLCSQSGESLVPPPPLPDLEQGGSEEEEQQQQEQQQQEQQQQEQQQEEQQQEEQQKEVEGAEQAEREEVAEEDRTNNYWNARQWSSGSSTISRDGNWANHCSRPSPFRVVAPRRGGFSPPDHRFAFQPVPGPCVLRNHLELCRDVPSTEDRDSWQRKALVPAPVKTRWQPSPEPDFYPVLDVSPQSFVPASPELEMDRSCDNLEGKNMLGEVAFQLERRILDYVFSNSLPYQAAQGVTATTISTTTTNTTTLNLRRRHFFGYTLTNIGEMINQEALSGERYSRGTERMLRERLGTMLDILTPMGYDLLEHGAFSQGIINKYGLLSKPPTTSNITGTSPSELGIPGISVADLQNYIFDNADTDVERDTLLLIFDCLRMLAIEDGRSVFVW